MNEENERHKRTIDEQKEQIKTLGSKLKESESEMNEEKQAKVKLQEKIKEKERELSQVNEQAKKLEAKHEKLLEKSKSEKSSL
jgi:hypothetical protein